MIVCPRCGREGYLEQHKIDRYSYWRVIHYYKDANGKKHKRVCYLGPVNRQYLYVEKVHKLGLTNILHQDVYTIIQNAVMRFIDSIKSKIESENNIDQLVFEVRKLRERLLDLIRELTQLEEEIIAMKK